MKTLKLGNTGEMISSIALGTIYFGTRIDEQTAFSILEMYVAKGGTLLDSANKYAIWVPGFKGGESEKLLGKWIKKRGTDKMFSLPQRWDSLMELFQGRWKKKLLFLNAKRA